MMTTEQMTEQMTEHSNGQLNGLHANAKTFRVAETLPGLGS